MNIQEDRDTGRLSYLGTGIGSLEAAKRYLRQKFRKEPLPEVVSRPGARFYVTARSGKQAAYLLGPYASHMTALAKQTQARALLQERFPNEAGWAAIGTASRPDTVPTRFGR